MSKPLSDDDGFHIITRSRKNKVTKLPQNNTKFIKENIDINIKRAKRRVLSCIEELQDSLYLKEVIRVLGNILQSKSVVEIVCFGLGHIGECSVSQYQLALLLCLKTIFKPIKVSVHDPIFYTNECTVLKDLELSVIEHNNEGSYIITNQGTALVYLPHCPKQLTDNFLWSNWGLNLENCILFCNSFSTLIESQPTRFIESKVPFIHKISPLTTEVHIENSFTHKDIFNDTSIHYFAKDKLTSVPTEFWTREERRVCENAEEFITKLMVEKLTF